MTYNDCPEGFAAGGTVVRPTRDRHGLQRWQALQLTRGAVGYGRSTWRVIGTYATRDQAERAALEAAE